MHDTLISELLDGEPLRAAQFIVTLYGDVVEPRGGRLWMGTLIEVCATVGISETRVRTAVSRLVAAGRLEGLRQGRRSYYSLTEGARREFAEAARRVFSERRATGWLIAGTEDASLQREGFAPLASGLFIGADHGGAPPEAPLLLRAELLRGQDALRRFAAAHWDLAGNAATYSAFLMRFAPVADAAAVGSLGEEACFVARTLLVHDFRATVLRDPGLPREALPEDWPGRKARELFAGLYLALTPGADSHIGRSFEGLEGRLPATSAATRARLGALRLDVG